MELAILIGLLEREEIPYFIFGQYLGSLLPGLQIAAYNERRIMVPKPYIEEAIEIIEEFRRIDVRMEQTYTLTSKIRMVFEALFFGWFISGGKKKPSNKSLKLGTPQSGAP
jgi:hypothetical protein